MPWDPAQYSKFGGQRLRPALDLIARLPLDSPAAIVDLGCGTGTVTRLLRERWPAARITGVDGSAEMLAKARSADPHTLWREADIATWTADSPVDLLFTNAALHWLPSHELLLPRLLSMVAPGGVLAIQMPRQWGEPSHRTLDAIAALPRWCDRFRTLAKPWSHPPTFYFDLLAPRCSALDIWESVYLQALEGENAVAEWTKGTVLIPYLDALPAGDRASFESEFRQRLAQAYPPRADGRTLFPFRRLFIVARK